MAIKRTEHVKSFLVERPSGETDIVDMFQQIINAASQNDPNGEILGLKSLKLRNGRSVNYKDENTFEDIFPKETLKVIKELDV